MKKAMHKIKQRPNQKLPREVKLDESERTELDMKRYAKGRLAPDWFNYGILGFHHNIITRKDRERCTVDASTVENLLALT